MEPIVAIDAEMPVSHVAALFREGGRDYLPVIEGEEQRVLGLCGRGEIGLAAAGREGERPVRGCLLPEPLLLAAATPLDAVLEATFRRQGSSFHHDVVVVDGLAPEERRLLGLVSLRVLVDFQSRQVGEQVAILARKEEMLRQALTAQFRHSVEMRRVQKRDQQMHDELRQAAQQQFRTSMDLRRSQARYHTLFENSAVGVALLDTAGVSATYNRYFASLLRLAPPIPGAVPPPVDVCDFMPMSARAEFLSALMRLESMPADAPPTSLELPLEIGPDRHESRFRFTLSWIADAAQVCLCAADVTEERNLQKKILQQEKDVLLESLLGGIAHELNNKALPLLGFGELLAGEAAQGADPAKIAGYTQVLKKSSAEFAAVVHQLLQLVKPSGAKAQSVDLRKVAREVAGLMAFPLRDARIIVVEQFPDEAIHVTADEAQVKQIAVNLVLNAIDALHSAFRKELVFRIRVGNGQAFLDLVDTGSGIAADVLPRIFDPFFTTKSAETARGLGLSVSRSLARQNHGEITVESKPGEGSTFLLRLPLALSCPLPARDEAPAPAPAEMPPVAEAPAPAPAPARPPAILVVDDEENVGSLVQEVLRRKFKGEVRRAYNGEEGVAEIEARGDDPFDLVVSDVRMPVKNGLEMFRWIAEHRPGLVPHFFFMTGHDGTNEMSEEIARSDVPVLRKPFAIAALVEMCNKRMAGAAKTG